MSKKPIAIFEEDQHVYHVRGKKAISVTTLIGMFHDSFQAEYWQTHGAFKLLFGEEQFKDLKRSKNYKFPETIQPPVSFFAELATMVDHEEFFECKKEVQKDWKLSATNGTEFHLERELEMYDKGFAINPWTQEKCTVHNIKKEYDNQSIKDNLYELEDGVYPELLVYLELENVSIAGQVDVAFLSTEKDIRYVDMDDYKTNKKIGGATSYKKFNSPFKHIDNTKIGKYSFQQSMYSYILSTYGFVPRNQAITHYKDYDVSTARRYDLVYYEDEVKKMLELVDKFYA